MTALAIPFASVPDLGAAKIFKEECMLCFYTPETPGGLYVCLRSLYGFCPRHIGEYAEKNPENKGFLHFVRRRVKKVTENNEEDGQREEKVTKLAIGVPGGFKLDGNQYDFDDRYTVVLYPNLHEEFSLTDPRVSEELRNFVDGLIAADGALRLQALGVGAAAWDVGPVVETKHTNLEQCENPPKIPTQGLRCQWVEGCEKEDNLWLNLTSGVVLCGRKFFDGTGGNGHAAMYYEQTKYPLAVKLGTITPSGADVYSYDEDDMVSDPNLAQHLAHFGINMMMETKTEKTMMELELDLNQKYEYSAIQEEGAQLKPIYGPGYTGLVNMGSSCYMNSVLQMLCMSPEFRKLYFEKGEVIGRTIGEKEPTEDFNLQMMKLVCGLMSGDYSPKPPVGSDADLPDYSIIGTAQDELAQQHYAALNGIRPMQFKTLVGKGHAEFSTAKQQDAAEYILHLFEKVEQNLWPEWSNPVAEFRFKTEERLLDSSSGKVRYGRGLHTILPVPIPMDCAVNMDEVRQYEETKQKMEAENKTIPPEHVIRPRIPLMRCLEAFGAEELIPDYRSPVTGEVTVARRTVRMGSYPDFLLIQAKKFVMADDWTSKKLDVELDVPDGEMDLSFLRGTGLQPGEQLLPEDIEVAEGVSEGAGPELDEGVVGQLADMGFPRDACRKAVYLTRNSGVESATNWVMEHMADADFDQPHPDLQRAIGAEGKGSTEAVNPEAVSQLTVLGFSANQARVALGEAKGNVEQAAEILFTTGDQIPTDAPVSMETTSSSGDDSLSEVRDGSSRYKLVGFISHMGSNTSCGHYVAHLLKEGKWVIYNDEKVALSEKPPKGLAYIYLLQRVE